MNFNPPLAYESLKTVLQYMNPNLRIRLSINCPSIRSAEKAVPLKINELRFTDQSFLVDDVEYQTGIYKKYPVGGCPPSVKEKNENGGWWIDLDQHGYEDWPSRLTLRPGDVDLRSPFDRNRAFLEIDEDEIEENRELLTDLEKRLDYVERLGPINPHYDLSYKQSHIETILNYFMQQRTTAGQTSNFKVRKEFEHARARAYKELMYQVLDTKAILGQWDARRDGFPVPFKSYIMLTIRDDKTGEKKKVEFVKYEKRLFEALNYLMHRIFENRRHPVAVKLLITNAAFLRLTPGVRMQIEEMTIFGEADRAFTEMAPYIEESSYPLKKLCLAMVDTAVIQHPKLTSAQYFVYDGIDEDIEWLPILLNLENHKVHINCECDDEQIISVDDFMTLIKRWISSEKREGASLSFSLFNVFDELEMDEFHEQVFRKIKKTFKNYNSGPRYARIPTNNGTTLRVSVEPSGEEANPWNFVLQILPSEHM